MASKNAETRPKYAYRGPTLRRDVTRGDIQRNIERTLDSKGSKLISINWKKNTVHYIDEKGTKRSESINVHKPRMRRAVVVPMGEGLIEKAEPLQKAIETRQRAIEENISMRGTQPVFRP